MDKEKKAYFVNLTEVKDGKIREVMNFNFGGHHDLAELVERLESRSGIKDKHAKQIVLGVRFLHHALKKNIDNPVFAAFLDQLNAFKDTLKEKY